MGGFIELGVALEMFWSCWGKVRVSVDETSTIGFGNIGIERGHDGCGGGECVVGFGGVWFLSAESVNFA